MENSSVFIHQLTKKQQTEIRTKLSNLLWNEGCSLNEIDEILIKVMLGRLFDIQCFIDISIYSI